MAENTIKWEDGPFGDRRTEFDVAIETAGTIALDQTIPVDQRRAAMLSVVRLVIGNREVAEDWSGDALRRYQRAELADMVDPKGKMNGEAA